MYVYIDPRNYEKFYYGKRKGSRKEAHLSDGSDSLKAERIAAIHKEGLAHDHSGDRARFVRARCTPVGENAAAVNPALLFGVLAFSQD